MKNSATRQPVRIYIIEDHYIVRAGLRSIFEDYAEIQVLGEAANAATALKELAVIHPDVVLLDLRLPDQDGCAICQVIKALPNPPRVLMLTSFGEEANVLSAMGAGADGYVLKSCSDNGIMAAITTVMSGGMVWPSLAFGTVKQALHRISDKGENKLDSLLPRERWILAQIAQGKTNKEIAAEAGMPEKTLRNHVSNLLRKLDLERRTQAAAYYIKHSA
jgi:DNA-binding NarL/FixJ family response regulator